MLMKENDSVVLYSKYQIVALGCVQQTYKKGRFPMRLKDVKEMSGYIVKVDWNRTDLEITDEMYTMWKTEHWAGQTKRPLVDESSSKSSQYCYRGDQAFSFAITADLMANIKSAVQASGDAPATASAPSDFSDSEAGEASEAQGVKQTLLIGLIRSVNYY